MKQMVKLSEFEFLNLFDAILVGKKQLKKNYFKSHFVFCNYGQTKIMICIKKIWHIAVFQNLFV